MISLNICSLTPQLNHVVSECVLCVVVCFVLMLCVVFQEMEYDVLEQQLQKTLTDLDKREKALAHAEMEVM